MSTLSNQPYNSTSNLTYNIGDCIEFKRFIPSTGPDVFEYIVSNGKIINNKDPELLEVHVCGDGFIFYNNNNGNNTNTTTTSSGRELAWVNPESIVRHYPKERIPQLTPRIILRETWKDFVIREIKTVKAKDLELISYDYINDSGFVRTESFPSVDVALKNVDINKHCNIHTHYKDYFGFTTHRALRNNDIYCNQEIFFSRKCYGELNLNGTPITGNFSLRRGFKSIPPRKKQFICGLVEMGEKGLFYRKWFICTNEFLTLWTMICEPEHYSLRNKINNIYVTKSLDELLKELDTSIYSLPYLDNFLDNHPDNQQENKTNENKTEWKKIKETKTEGKKIKETKTEGNKIEGKKFKETKTEEIEYRSYNVENHVLYIPNIYQNIATALFRPNRNNDDMYLTYEERLRSDLVWMKNF